MLDWFKTQLTKYGAEMARLDTESCEIQSRMARNASQLNPCSDVFLERMEQLTTELRDVHKKRAVAAGRWILLNDAIAEAEEQLEPVSTS